MPEYIIQFKGSVECAHSKNSPIEYQVPHPSFLHKYDSNFPPWSQTKPSSGADINIAHARKEYIKAMHIGSRPTCQCLVEVIEL